MAIGQLVPDIATDRSSGGTIQGCGLRVIGCGIGGLEGLVGLQADGRLSLVRDIVPHDTCGAEGDAVSGHGHSLVIEGVDCHIGDLSANLKHIRGCIRGHNHIAAVEASGFRLYHHSGGQIAVGYSCFHRDRNWTSLDKLEDHKSARADGSQEGTVKVDDDCSSLAGMGNIGGAHLEHEVVQDTGQLIAHADIAHLLIIRFDNGHRQGCILREGHTVGGIELEAAIALGDLGN